jgi:hypothetical protein
VDAEKEDPETFKASVVELSQQVKADPAVRLPFAGTLKGEFPRPIHVPTLFHPRYHICIRGSSEQEAVIREALKGNVDRYGILSLGESDDVVTWMTETPLDSPTEWVVEGSTIPLTVRSATGFNTYAPEVRSFQFGDQPHWISFSDSKSSPESEDFFSYLDAT